MKTSRLIFPFDKSGEEISPYLNTYSSVAASYGGSGFPRPECASGGRSYLGEIALKDRVLSTICCSPLLEVVQVTEEHQHLCIKLNLLPEYKKDLK